jgi:hypothetical protein
VPLKLADALKQDLALRRFSFLTFDVDQPDTVSTIRGQNRMGSVVGAAFPQDPDFEFANFDLAELVEIAATIDDEAGLLHHSRGLDPPHLGTRHEQARAEVV